MCSADSTQSDYINLPPSLPPPLPPLQVHLPETRSHSGLFEWLLINNQMLTGLTE